MNPAAGLTAGDGRPTSTAIFGSWIGNMLLSDLGRQIRAGEKPAWSAADKMEPANLRPLVLVIEDDDSVRTTLIDILELEGFAALGAGDGEEGILLAHENRPAVIVTDISMPRFDGYAVLRALKADPRIRDVPVIIVSAWAEKARVAKGLEHGAVEYISKPFRPDHLVAVIKSHLPGRRPQDGA